MKVRLFQPVEHHAGVRESIRVILSLMLVLSIFGAAGCSHDADAHHRLGSALYAKGQYEGAIAEYREAIRLNPDLALAHNGLGSALCAKGQYDAAIAEYRKAIRLNPDYAHAHNNLGLALDVAGQPDAAIASSRRPSGSTLLTSPRRTTTWVSCLQTRVSTTPPSLSSRKSSGSNLTMPGRITTWAPPS